LVGRRIATQICEVDPAKDIAERANDFARYEKNFAIRKSYYICHSQIGDNLVSLFLESAYLRKACGERKRLKRRSKTTSVYSMSAKDTACHFVEGGKRT
jgi:hypothetical protein